MKLVRIDVRNFRLLQNAAIRTDDAGAVTILVGPNNSGKTSVAEALLLFAGDTERKFSVYDFSVSTRKSFDSIQAKILNNDAVETYANEWPIISLDMHFAYEATAEDLAVASDLLMDLTEGASHVGIRIQFAPKDILALSADFREQRRGQQTLFEFLQETLSRYYGLTFYKISEDGTKSQTLDDGKILSRVLKIDFVWAQRHIDDQENSRATRLSHLLHAHYEKHYKDENPDDHKAIEETLRAHAGELGGKYMAAFDGLIKSLGRFGYAQRRAPSISIRAELNSHTLFHDNTRIYYGASSEVITEIKTAAQPAPPAVPAIGNGAPAPIGQPATPLAWELPEKYNGLGFKNLIYMILQIQSYRVALDRMVEERPRVHLIFIEEPETHLHPHMQSIFVKEISAFIADGKETTDAQVVLTTHSSHIVSDSGFSPIRYFRRKGIEVAVKDLLVFEKTRGDDVIRFLNRYLSFVGCDLFFADKAIFVEGQVERLLLPQMIIECSKRTKPEFAKEYITVMEIGGAHAHRFEELTKFIEIPTLVITDIDAVGDDRKKCPVKDGTKTSNATLKSWLPKLETLTDLLSADAEKKMDGKSIRVAYQIPDEGHPCGRSFEEAFIYRNAEWLIQNKGSLIGSADVFDQVDAATLRNEAFGLPIVKVDFALDLMVAAGWSTPNYIAEGLDWLAKCEVAA